MSVVLDVNPATQRLPGDVGFDLWQKTPKVDERPLEIAEPQSSDEPREDAKGNGVPAVTAHIENASISERSALKAATKSMPKVPPSGVWAPAITFFDQSTDNLDTDSQAKYYSYLSKTGLAGLVVLGTNSETFLLTREERKTLLETARKACGPSYPIMAGVGGHSTKQVLEFIQDAADAGADYALLLPPAYFGKQTTPAVIDSFFNDVASASPLPIVIYNFPVVCNGIDLDSATIARLAKTYPNIVGVKLTCGAVAKITRLAAELPQGTFATFGGQSDFLIGGLAAGSQGTIAGFANVFPKTLVRIYDLYKEAKFQEAMELHKKAALAEQPCKAGIASVKFAAALHTAKAAGIDSPLEKLKPRRPYIEPSEEQKKSIQSQIAVLEDIEASL
ncbi:putative 4-hydroxy-2-oxoglutarate aldolase, mitochondrial [Exophiala dermatitidis]